MTRRISLALQGGGAHGAFTWGVLDRLLDEPDIEIAGISGTSAGALNGAAFKSGIVADGRDGARSNLAWLWEQVGAINDLRLSNWIAELPMMSGLIGQAIEYSLPYMAVDSMTRMVSPYAYGPMYQNPLERIVRQFEYDQICAGDAPQLFICATNVRSGKIRVFSGDEISSHAILASACLPTLFQAVEFDDPRTGTREAFWDGGYTGNPALFPLFADHLPSDLLIVNINPLQRDDLPTTPQSIQNRINEISFNSSLLRELRAIAFVKRLLHEGALQPGTMRDMRVHMISDDELMNELSVATKQVPSPFVMAKLRRAGQNAADRFLTQDGDKIGDQGTVDLEEMFG